MSTTMFGRRNLSGTFTIAARFVGNGAGQCRCFMKLLYNILIGVSVFYNNSETETTWNSEHVCVKGAWGSTLHNIVVDVNNNNISALFIIIIYNNDRLRNNNMFGEFNNI